VINGSHDVIIYTANSLVLQRNLPNAQLILYPDFSTNTPRCSSLT
jgi:hypothetical protein